MCTRGQDTSVHRCESVYTRGRNTSAHRRESAQGDGTGVHIGVSESVRTRGRERTDSTRLESTHDARSRSTTGEREVSGSPGPRRSLFASGVPDGPSGGSSVVSQCSQWASPCPSGAVLS